MKKKNDLVWSISLILISIATIVLVGSNIVGLKLPDVAVRIIGIIDIVAIPFLVFSQKKSKERLTANWNLSRKGLLC